MTRVAVYCGAHRGARPEFADAAAKLGRALGRRGLGLFFGGGGVGLMGSVADAALEAGAEVIGFLNVAAFFDPLLGVVDRCVAEGFVRAESAGTLLVESRVEALLDRLGVHQPASALQSFTRPTA